MIKQIKHTRRKAFRQWWLVAALLSTLLLGACSNVNTAPEKTYYVLQSDTTTRLTQISGEPQLSIRYVKLPNYLNQQGIARQLPNGKVNVSYTNLWAEKLSQAIPTLLAENLAVQLGEPVEIHPLPPGIHVASIVEVNITRFIGDEQQLHLKGSYRLVKPKQLQSYQFDTQVPLTDHQTTTLVEAYALAIKQLSADIARHL